MKRIFLASLPILLLTACNSTSDLGNQYDGGKSITTSGHSYDEVWDTTLAVLNESHGDQSYEVDRSIQIVEQNKETGTIKGNVGVGLWSWGEVVGVFITPSYDAPVHKIEVQSRAKYKLSVHENDWSEDVLAELAKKLAQTKH